jgi:hypothetical protein
MRGRIGACTGASMHHLVILSLVLGGCGVFHLPDLYARAALQPGRNATADRAAVGESVRLELGLSARLDPPPAPLELEPPEVPALGPPAPCRISIACAWERRAAAEARARVIGGAP